MYMGRLHENVVSSFIMIVYMEYTGWCMSSIHGNILNDVLNESKYTWHIPGSIHNGVKYT